LAGTGKGLLFVVGQTRTAIETAADQTSLNNNKKITEKERKAKLIKVAL